MAIQAIETVYRGYRFRSRLEARWAVFFDSLGVQYAYEKEGYDLGDGLRYLPDFWLPKQEMWVEVKGDPNDRSYLEKVERLAKGTGFPVLVVHDVVMPRDDWSNRAECDWWIWFSDGGADGPYWWCECPTCGLIGAEFDGRSDRLPCKTCYVCELLLEGKTVAVAADGKCPGHGEPKQVGCPRSSHGDKGYNHETPRIAAAYAAARQARFEHGERP